MAYLPRCLIYPYLLIVTLINDVIVAIAWSLLTASM